MFIAPLPSYIRYNNVGSGADGNNNNNYYYYLENTLDSVRTDVHMKYKHTCILQNLTNFWTERNWVSGEVILNSPRQFVTLWFLINKINIIINHLERKTMRLFTKLNSTWNWKLLFCWIGETAGIFGGSGYKPFAFLVSL